MYTGLWMCQTWYSLNTYGTVYEASYCFSESTQAQNSAYAQSSRASRVSRVIWGHLVMTAQREQVGDEIWCSELMSCLLWDHILQGHLLVHRLISGSSWLWHFKVCQTPENTTSRQTITAGKINETWTGPDVVTRLQMKQCLKTLRVESKTYLFLIYYIYQFYFGCIQYQYHFFAQTQ